MLLLFALLPLGRRCSLGEVAEGHQVPRPGAAGGILPLEARCRSRKKTCDDSGIVVMLFPEML